jgi:hypothetical protein
MPQSLANANKPIEIVQFGVNWWGYKVYVAKSGLKLVDNGDGLHTLSDNDDIDSDPYARVKADRFKIVDKFSD